MWGRDALIMTSGQNMLTEENNWQTCLQNPLNIFDLKYCALKLKLLLVSNEVTCVIFVVWQCFGGSKSEKHCTLDACRVRAMCVCIYCTMYTGHCYGFCTPLFNSFVLLFTKSHYRTIFDFTHDIVSTMCYVGVTSRALRPSEQQELKYYREVTAGACTNP